MRRLRILTAIPLVAGLLFAGAATTAAQSGVPGIPSVPGLGSLPYVNAGFPCEFPQIVDEFRVTNPQDWPVTDESFVFLMQSQTQTPSPNPPGMGQLPDLSFMKCFFHYPQGAVTGVPVTDHGFPCAYPTDNQLNPTTPTANPQVPFHPFAHSMFVVRDTFAILLCWGTAQVP